MLVYTVQDLEKHRSKLWIGDIIMVHRNPGFFAPSAFIIQMATNGPWNHVGLLNINKDNGELMILEADTTRGNIEVPLSKYDNKDHYITVLRPLFMKDGKTRYTKQAGINAIAEARKLLGLKYDFTAIAGFTIEVFSKGIIKLLFKRIGNPLQLNNRYFCSEYVITSLRAADIMICNGIQPGAISPNDIFRDLYNSLKIVDLVEDDTKIAFLYNKELRKDIREYILDEQGKYIKSKKTQSIG